MIETATLSLADEGARGFDAYLARPSKGERSGIVMVHDMFGLNASIRYIAGEFARRGHAVLVPNMFWRSAIPQALEYDDAQHPVAWERLKALDLDVACEDIATAVRWLRAQPFSTGKVAVIGFCGGGRIAFLAAARTDVDAAVALYGLHISQHLDELAQREMSGADSLRSARPAHPERGDRRGVGRHRGASRGARRAADRGAALPEGRAFVLQSRAADVRSQAKQLAVERIEALLAGL